MQCTRRRSENCEGEEEQRLPAQQAHVWTSRLTAAAFIAVRHVLAKGLAYQFLLVLCGIHESILHRIRVGYNYRIYSVRH